MTRFSGFSSLVAYVNAFGLSEKLCRLHPFMHALALSFVHLNVCIVNEGDILLQIDQGE